MALSRLSPGVYRDSKTGKTVKAKSLAEAKKAAGGNQGKRTGGGATPAPTPGAQGPSISYQFLGPSAEDAAALANYAYAPGSLGRVDETMSPEVNDYLAQQRAMAAFYGPGGQQRSAEMQDHMARQKAGLEGYNAPEMTAMREQAGRQNDAAYANQRALAMQNQARSGVRGASANAQLMSLARAKAGQDAQLNQDMMIKNADERQRRLSAYGQELGGLEGKEFDRARLSLGDYGSDLAATRNDVLDRQKFNISQTAAEKAGSLGTLFGGVGVAQENEAAKREDRFRRGMLNVARRRGAGGGSTPDYMGYANANLAQYGG